MSFETLPRVVGVTVFALGALGAIELVSHDHADVRAVQQCAQDLDAPQLDVQQTMYDCQEYLSDFKLSATDTSLPDQHHQVLLMTGEELEAKELPDARSSDSGEHIDEYFLFGMMDIGASIGAALGTRKVIRWRAGRRVEAAV